MNVIDRIYLLALPYLETRSNQIHIAVSKRFGESLLLMEKGDPEVVIPAILLHDVGWSKLTAEMQNKAFGPGCDQSLNRIHEVEGVRIAAGILAEVNYNKTKAEEIINIIDGHDSRLTTISDNDMIVKDSDKLFRFTSEGLIFFLNIFKVTIEERLSWLNSKVDSWFFTQAAKVMAADEYNSRNNYLKNS